MTDTDVSSVSGERMGEGSGTPLAIPTVDKVRVVPSKEPIVGEGGGKGRDFWGILVSKSKEIQLM